MNKKLGLLCLLVLSNTVSAHELFSKSPLEYISTKIYQVPYTKSLVTKSGTYDNDSPLLKIDSKPVKSINILVDSNQKQKEYKVLVERQIAYIKSVTVQDKGKEITPYIAKEGFNGNFLIKDNKISSFSLKFVKLETISSKKVGEDFVGLPQTNKTLVSYNNLNLSLGKTLRYDSAPYKVKGKEYQRIILLSLVSLN